MDKITELMKMDKRTKAYKFALNAYRAEQAKKEDAIAFLNFCFSLTMEEKREILNACDNCFLIYLHGNAATVESLRKIKEKKEISWRTFNAYCLKFCELAKN